MFLKCDEIGDLKHEKYLIYRSQDTSIKIVTMFEKMIMSIIWKCIIIICNEEVRHWFKKFQSIGLSSTITFLEKINWVNRLIWNCQLLELYKNGMVNRLKQKVNRLMPYDFQNFVSQRQCQSIDLLKTLNFFKVKDTTLKQYIHQC